MTNLTPQIVLHALVKHETLTLPDLMEEHNLGVPLAQTDVENALVELKAQKLVSILEGTEPTTYTITRKGIEQSVLSTTRYKK